MNSLCAVGMGANLGDPEATLERAINLMRLHHGLSVSSISSFWLTEPVGGPKNQNWFFNRVILLSSSLTTVQVFRVLSDIELLLGRIRTEKWGPRLIDLDFLFRDQEVLELPELIIPHPMLHERGFVLKPLAEVAPDWVHPFLKLTVTEMLERLPPGGPEAKKLP
ncbi:MAG: 2-amino-4-hydroxy-6-hydroxymethyldihydropteridine diphosphokinase [Deltaproteobacteria bacterium]|jgi:2-amino-4-hydroxy-6-hydroxymethyldihydropteridine diphosphokinase|nr:2-amino-4-hydroxy-6-hydroxymethyldihydropteridine diphosphokinase [Deltaproteobacteria bacterium]